MSDKRELNKNSCVPRCLVVTFKSTSDRNGLNENGLKLQDKTVIADENKQNPSPEDVFNIFVAENKLCFWDPHIRESFCNLSYFGCLRIHSSQRAVTVLCSGKDRFLDTIKKAWSKRVLQSPGRYKLKSIGELHSVEVESISQAQFTPLPEALCMIVSKLNRANAPATLTSIMDQLKDIFKGVKQPAEELVYEMLSSLIKEHKIFHTGLGYHIFTPELFNQLNQLQYSLPPDGLLHHNDQPVCHHGKPLPSQCCPTDAASTLPDGEPLGKIHDTCSIGCQTVERLPSPEAPAESQANKKDKVQRSQSFLDSKHMKRELPSPLDQELGTFSRAASFRLSPIADENDVNFNTHDSHKKHKSDKVSFLGKLFRSRRHKPRPPPSILEISASEEDPIGTPEVEHVTFSAQFPPLDGSLWISTDSRGVAGTPQPWGPPVLSTTAYSMPRKPTVRMSDVETQSDVFDDSFEMLSPRRFSKHKKCVPKSKTLPENMSNLASSYRNNVEHLGGDGSQMGKLGQEAPATRAWQKLSSHLQRPVPEIPRSGRPLIPDYLSGDSNDETGGIYEDIHESKSPVSKHHSVQQSTLPKTDTKLKSKVFKKYKEQNGRRLPQNEDYSCNPNDFLASAQRGFSKSQNSGVNCVGLPGCAGVPTECFSGSGTSQYGAPFQYYGGACYNNLFRPCGATHRGDVYSNDSGFYSPHFPAPWTDHPKDSYMPYTDFHLGLYQHMKAHHVVGSGPCKQEDIGNDLSNKSSTPGSSNSSSRQTLETAFHYPVQQQNKAPSPHPAPSQYNGPSSRKIPSPHQGPSQYNGPSNNKAPSPHQGPFQHEVLHHQASSSPHQLLSSPFPELDGQNRNNIRSQVAEDHQRGKSKPKYSKSDKQYRDYRARTPHEPIMEDEYLQPHSVKSPQYFNSSSPVQHSEVLYTL